MNTTLKAEKLMVKTNVSELLALVKKPEISSEYNKDNFNKNILNGDPGFCGGQLNDLFAAPDMGPYQRLRKKLDRSGFLSKLKTKIGHSPRRSRFRSEYEGEWELHRKWDLKPFMHTERAQSSHRTLDIIFHTAFNGAVGSKRITEMGTLVAAISDFIECQGIQTNIILRKQNNNVANRCNSLIDVTVKKAGEYITPATLCKVFSSNFYRRALFTMIIVGCDRHNKKACDSFGQPHSEVDGVQFKDGALHLGSSIDGGYEARIEREILKALSLEG